MTTMVESLPPPPCCVSEPSFAPCALDNARCRELQTAPRSPHGVNVRGARELETHPVPWRGAPLACRSGLVPNPWRVASPAFHKEHCFSHQVPEEHWTHPRWRRSLKGTGSSRGCGSHPKKQTLVVLCGAFKSVERVDGEDHVRCVVVHAVDRGGDEQLIVEDFC